jgi:ABC-type polar amino acid transport system ATPase subunit
MTDLAAGGTTMVVVTHELGFARHVAHRLVFMEAGRIVMDAATAEALGPDCPPRFRAFLDRVA